MTKVGKEISPRGLKDILGFSIFPNDIVVCTGTDEKLEIGFVTMVTRGSVVVRKWQGINFGEERYELPSEHVMLVDKSKLREDNDLHRMLLNEMVLINT